LEKLACGRFSDNSFIAAGKKRGFCRLRRRREGACASPTGCQSIGKTGLRPFFGHQG
jgi:hypothetical protein